MFHLVNQFGNVHKMVQSEAKKNEMLKDGWKVVEEPQQADEPQNATDPTISYTTEPEQKPKGKGKSNKTEKE